MNDIDEIAQKVASVYASGWTTSTDESDSPTVDHWLNYANQYVAAAGVIQREAPQHWLPKIQLTGHAIECCLKACVQANGVTPPHDHDLIKLMKLANAPLSRRDVTAICHLQNLYFSQFGTDAKFRARYPDGSHTVGGVVPEISHYVAIIGELSDIAKQRIHPNRD